MDLNFQLATELGEIPREEDFVLWVRAALKHLKVEEVSEHSLCIRVVDEEEISALNQTYRNKQGSTNVLSFPQDVPDFVTEATQEKALGDIVLCAPVVARQALEQNKEIIAHWAHLTVHGVLHLLDYDHENQEEADAMESIEIAILHQLGFANPY